MVLATYDPEAKALYVEIQKGSSSNKKLVAKTIPSGHGNYLDVSESGDPVGLEIIYPRSTPQEEIDAIISRNSSSSDGSNSDSGIIEEKQKELLQIKVLR